ncbi:MAG: K(+)-transporting ATPase subunit F [Ectobacillus sp.]
MVRSCSEGRENEMIILWGIVAAVTVYLVYALLNPEKF